MHREDKNICFLSVEVISDCCISPPSCELHDSIVNRSNIQVFDKHPRFWPIFHLKLQSNNGHRIYYIIMYVGWNIIRSMDVHCECAECALIRLLSSLRMLFIAVLWMSQPKCLAMFESCLPTRLVRCGIFPVNVHKHCDAAAAASTATTEKSGVNWQIWSPTVEDRHRRCSLQAWHVAEGAMFELIRVNSRV